MFCSFKKSCLVPFRWEPDPPSIHPFSYVNPLKTTFKPEAIIIPYRLCPGIHRTPPVIVHGHERWAIWPFRFGMQESTQIGFFSSYSTHPHFLFHLGYSQDKTFHRSLWTSSTLLWTLVKKISFSLLYASKLCLISGIARGCGGCRPHLVMCTGVGVTLFWPKLQESLYLWIIPSYYRPFDVDFHKKFNEKM